MSTAVAPEGTADTVLDTAQAAVDALAAADTEKPAADAVVDDRARGADGKFIAKPADTIEYTLKVPDGSEANPALVERTTADARAWGLSNDAGQKLLESRVKDAADAAAQQSTLTEAWKPGGAEWTKRNDAWTADAKADPEIVGADGQQFDVTVGLAQRALAKYGPEMTKVLTETGMGSHPAAIKFLARIGRAMSEAEFIPGGSVNGGRPKSDAQVMFPDHYNPDGSPKSVGA